MSEVLKDLFGEMNKIYSPDTSAADKLLADTETLSKNIDRLLAENASLRRMNQELRRELAECQDVEPFRNEDYSE